MPRPEIHAALEGLDDLPPLPGILTRLLASLGRPHVSLDEIDDLIRQDPLLAGRVLRGANSAAYGARVPARFIRDAVLRLGLSEVRRLTVALSAVAALPVHTRRPEYETFWAHSLGVARTAEAVAKRAQGLPPPTDPETIFLAGLFHDIGQLALINRRPALLDQVTRLASAQGLREFEAEIVVVGTDHGELGARIAERWNLPDFVVGAIRGHHRLEHAPEEHRGTAAVVAAAEFLYSHEGLGDLGEVFPVSIEDGIFEALGLEVLGLTVETSLELARRVAEDLRASRALLASAS